MKFENIKLKSLYELLRYFSVEREGIAKRTPFTYAFLSRVAKMLRDRGYLKITPLGRRTYIYKLTDKGYKLLQVLTEILED